MRSKVIQGVSPRVGFSSRHPGGAMTGELILNVPASSPNDVLRKGEADDLLNGVGVVSVNHAHDASDITGLDLTGLEKVTHLTGVAGNVQNLLDGFAEPGNTLSGALVLSQAPASGDDLATLAYLESKAPAATTGVPTGSVARKAFSSAGYAGWLLADGATPSKASYPGLQKKLWQHFTPTDVSAFGGGVGTLSSKIVGSTSYLNGFGDGGHLIILGNYVYSIGGLYWTEGSGSWPFTNNVVLRAPINQDGTFGTFVEYPCDFQGNFNSSFVVIGNRLYMLFGYSNLNGEVASQKVYYSIIAPNGDLSSFIEVPGVFNFTGICGAKAFVVGNKLHVVGGITLSQRMTAQTAIYTSVINPSDNTIGVFQENTTVTLPPGLATFGYSPLRVVRGTNSVVLIGHKFSYAAAIAANTPTQPIDVVGFSVDSNGVITAAQLSQLEIEGNTTIGNIFEDGLGNTYLEQINLNANRTEISGAASKLLVTKVDPASPMKLLTPKIHANLPCDWALNNSFLGETIYGFTNTSPKHNGVVYMVGLFRSQSGEYPARFKLQYYMLPLVDQTKQPNTENKDYKFSHRTFLAVGTGAPWQQQAEFNRAATFSEFNTLKDVLPEGIDHSQVVVTKNKVYLIGGRYQNLAHHGNIYMATFDANGVLGNFSLYATNAPNAALHRCFVYGNKVYHVGGLRGDGWWSNQIHVASIDANGGIGTWSLHSHLPEAIAAPSVVELKNYIYIVSGYVHEVGTPQIYEMAKLPGGVDLGAPVANAMAPLPSGTAPFASMISHKNNVFLVGGFERNTTYRAVVNYNHRGEISPFSVTNTNTLSNYVTSAGIHKAQPLVTMNKVILIGGSEEAGDNGVRLTHIFGFQADGNLAYEGLGPFLPIPTSNHQVFAIANKIYVVGVNSNGTMSKDAYVCSMLDGQAPVDYSPFYNGTYNNVDDASPTYVFGQKFLPDAIHGSPVFTLPDYSAVDEQLGPGVRTYIKT